MSFLKKTVTIFIKQLESILSGDSRLTQIRMKEKSFNKNQVTIQTETQLNERLIKQKAIGIAKLRFKGRSVSNVKVEDGQITVNFVPEK